jgi:hypothetical protein
VAPNPRNLTVPDRYDNLFRALDELEGRGLVHLRYLEVGTFDGKRAARLCRAWLKKPAPPGQQRSFHYAGFDLFEDMTAERSKAEFSKSTLPPSVGAVGATLTDAGAASILLKKGDTRHTLKDAVRGLAVHEGGTLPVALVFLDGGHSFGTVASDWKGLQPVIRPETIVLLDDYYHNKPDAGCRELVAQLTAPESGYQVEMLEPIDTVPGSGLKIQMVRAYRKAAPQEARQGAVLETEAHPR